MQEDIVNIMAYIIWKDEQVPPFHFYYLNYRSAYIFCSFTEEKQQKNPLITTLLLKRTA